MEAAQARGLKVVPDAHDELASEARQCADRLGLRDWTIIVYEDPPLDERNDAEVAVDAGRHAIVLRFRSDFRQLTEHQRLYLLVHELLHAHMQLPAAAVLGLREEFGTTAWRVFWGRYEDEVERVIDRLASAVAPLLVE